MKAKRKDTIYTWTSDTDFSILLGANSVIGHDKVSVCHRRIELTNHVLQRNWNIAVILFLKFPCKSEYCFLILLALIPQTFRGLQEISQSRLHFTFISAALHLSFLELFSQFFACHRADCFLQWIGPTHCVIHLDFLSEILVITTACSV